MVGGTSFNNSPYMNPYGAYTNYDNQTVKENGIKSQDAEKLNEPYCKTCDERRYQDGSSDEGVSFQTPTKINPSRSAVAVQGHEREHYSRNKAKAQRENKEVLSSTMQVFYSTCPECGRKYASGGVTKTLTKNKPDNNKNYKVNSQIDLSV